MVKISHFSYYKWKYYSKLQNVQTIWNSMSAVGVVTLNNFVITATSLISQQIHQLTNTVICSNTHFLSRATACQTKSQSSHFIIPHIYLQNLKYTYIFPCLYSMTGFSFKLPNKNLPSSMVPRFWYVPVVLLNKQSYK